MLDQAAQIFDPTGLAGVEWVTLASRMLKVGSG